VVALPDVTDPAGETRPWLTIAREDGREWWRLHPGAPLLEFYQWVMDEYEPMVLRNVRGARHARQFNRIQQDALDDVARGMLEAAEAELRRRPREDRLDHETVRHTRQLLADG
jgi:hypothetical protein